MFRVLQLRIKLIVFSLILASATGAQANISITPTGKAGVYQISIFDTPADTEAGTEANPGAGSLAKAITKGELDNAVTLIISTASGVSLNEDDVNALFYNDNSLVKKGTLKSLNLANANCTYPTTYDGKTNWSACLGSPNLQYLENLTYPKNMDFIPKLEGGNVKNLKKIIIPKKDDNDNSIYTLAEGCFQSVEKLEYLEIDNCVDEIPSSLCMGLNNLTEVFLNASITKIGDDAFKECKNLKYLSLPEGITEIGDNAFLNCAIAGIRLPSTLRTIGDGAFRDCHYLEEIVIPSNVESIGSNAFLSCNSLKDVYVKNANTKICWDSFDPLLMCRNIQEQYFPDPKTSINRESYWRQGSAFNINANNGQSLLHIYNDTNNSANQTLIAEYDARYSNTKTINGNQMYDYQNSTTKAYWPSSGDGTTLEDLKYNGTEEVEKLTTDANGKNPADDGYIDTYVLVTDNNGIKPTEDGYTPTYGLLANQSLSVGIYVYFNNAITLVNSSSEEYFRLYSTVLTADSNGKIPGEDGYTTTSVQLGTVIDKKPADEGYTPTYTTVTVDRAANATPIQSDARNWQRFALAETYSSNDEWSVNTIIDDTWYTICVPFDVTRSQIQTAFGASTEVCSFDGVKEVTINNQKILDIAFTSDLMATATSGSATVISKGVAYMIHPSTHTGTQGTSGIFTITGITEEECTPIATPGATGTGYIEGYSFIGTFSNSTLSTHAGSYFLACKTTEKYPRFFRATTNSGTWTAYTAIVTPPTNNGSTKSMSIYLGDEAIDYDPMIIEGTSDATEVNEISVANSIAAKADSHVYNMQGVYVGNSLNGLTKGIYIVNGKKYVVR